MSLSRVQYPGDEPVLRVACSGWYAWRNRRLRVNARQQFRLLCDAAVSTAFHQVKQRQMLSFIPTVAIADYQALLKRHHQRGTGGS
ncbi:hypothetical protein NKL93_000417 [Salmonella enterica]|nr:hypothetical protein [Salmonella enterica]EJO1929886.1 hypothetical protein [Salmonella enterica]